MSPTTVVHGRTRQRVTSPCRTYGSAAANASAAAGESPRKSTTTPSAGSANAPPRTNSPRAIAARAKARCSARSGAPLHVIGDHVVEEKVVHERSFRRHEAGGSLRKLGR